MDWFLYNNGLRHERVKNETELPHFKTKIKNGLLANAHVGLVILVSFRLFQNIDFTILFNACVLYLFMRWL